MYCRPRCSVEAHLWPRPLFLGIDVSTTGSKALLVDASWRSREQRHHAAYALHPRPLWSEQDPREWWRAVGDEHPRGA